MSILLGESSTTQLVYIPAGKAGYVQVKQYVNNLGYYTFLELGWKVIILSSTFEGSEQIDCPLDFTTAEYSKEYSKVKVLHFSSVILNLNF